MEMTTICNLLEELIKVVKVGNSKIDLLQDSVQKLNLNFAEVKEASDFASSKLKQVEEGMLGLDLPAYTGAILDLSQNVKIALDTVQAPNLPCPADPNSTTQSAGTPKQGISPNSSH